MRYTLFNIGKINMKYLTEGIQEYCKRINHFIDFSIIDLPDIRNRKSLSTAMIRKKEGELIVNAVAKFEMKILLDERGKEMNSQEFAKWLNNVAEHQMRNVAFITGGAYGFSEDVYHVTNTIISLSRFTFNHQLARLIFLEQLYRGFTIIKGLPYHNE